MSHSRLRCLEATTPLILFRPPTGSTVACWLNVDRISFVLEKKGQSQPKSRSYELLGWCRAFSLGKCRMGLKRMLFVWLRDFGRMVHSAGMRTPHMVSILRWWLWMEVSTSICISKDLICVDDEKRILVWEETEVQRTTCWNPSHGLEERNAWNWERL